MRKIKKWYSSFKWRDRLIAAFSIVAVSIALSLTLNANIINVILITCGLCIVAHLLLSKSAPLLLGSTFLLHLAMLGLVLPLYGSFSSTTSLGDSGFVYAVMIIVMATIALTWLSYKFSKGSLWLTLLVVYIALDFGGLIFMGLVMSNNIFIGLIPAAVMLAIRSIVWRDLFKSKVVMLPTDIKVSKNTDSLQLLISAMDDVEINNYDVSPVDFIVEKETNRFYINVVTLKKQIAIADGDIASDRYNLKSSLYATANVAKDDNRSRKRRNRKEIIPCLVNFSDKSDSLVEINISIKGDKRNKGDNILILSPSALVKLINRS